MFVSSREEKRKVRARWPTRYVGSIKVRALPSAERILEQFIYDCEKGAFYWRNEPAFRAGTIGSSGHRVVWLGETGSYWPEHRLVWKAVTGQDPIGVIDHINGVRDDNRFENLRDVTPEENAFNTIRGRWRNTVTERKLMAKERRKVERLAKAAAKEAKERATLARLKAKYEPN